MAVQTTYAQAPATAIAGLVADNAPSYSVSGNPDNGVVDAPGLFVARGAAEGTFKLPTSGAEVAAGLGVVAYQPAQIPTNYGVAALQGNPPRRILRRGLIWVTVEENVSDGDDAYVRFATGTAAQKGAFRKSADSATAAQLPGAKFRGGATAGNVCKVEVNLP